jgi:hypothetical protein
MRLLLWNALGLSSPENSGKVEPSHIPFCLEYWLASRHEKKCACSEKSVLDDHVLQPGFLAGFFAGDFSRCAEVNLYLSDVQCVIQLLKPKTAQTLELSTTSQNAH